MAKKAKKIPEPKKHDKRPIYRFTCLGCSWEFMVRAKSVSDAHGEAMNRHDDWHTKRGSFCDSDNFECEGPI